jgi:hypothetical protein
VTGRHPRCLTRRPHAAAIPHIGGVTDTVLVVTSALTALAATTAALFAGLAIRSQDRAQRRQQALENFRWLYNSWDALRSYRGRAARSLREDQVAVTDIREILNFLENVGYLVRRRYLDLEIAEAVFAPQIRGWWSVGQSVVASGRAEFGPTIFENLEWLHAQLTLAEPHSEGWRERFLSREEASLGEDPGGAPTGGLSSAHGTTLKSDARVRAKRSR